MSSSGHIALLPKLLGWSYAELPPHARKTFEVALHAGSVPALVLALRGQARPDPGLLALTLLPPAVAGLLLERPVEQRLGGTGTVAAAQAVAGAALLLADRRPQRRASADAVDHLAVGAAQALALVPGVSRSGAAVTAARLRGLTREEGASLALRAALPVTLGAGLLKGVHVARGGIDSDLRAPLAAGAATACVSALASLPLAGCTRWRTLACYRIALGLGALAAERARAV